MKDRFLYVALMATLVWSDIGYGEERIYRQDWLKIANATTMLQLPALQRVVSQFEAGDDLKIVIQYPGGDQGNQWAIELRDWLVSLGISSSDIELQPGSGIPETIVIKTEKDGFQ